MNAPLITNIEDLAGVLFVADVDDLTGVLLLLKI